MSQSCHMTAMVVCKPAFGIVSKVAFQFFSRKLIDVFGVSSDKLSNS
ncbi:hypothetical protein CK203_115405 [Vitis vinifera]|uniref:Uncharacterized protein n=1 Tax=Vitis vinifera TaxID=29760 RepID=A0A438C9D1_VITVI|nr:hypothetical protein CK203_115405 [Vitis vinifera]